MVLPDRVHRLKSPVSKPQLTRRFSGIALQILGAAAADPGRLVKPTAADNSKGRPETFLPIEVHHI